MTWVSLKGQLKVISEAKPRDTGRATNLERPFNPFQAPTSKQLTRHPNRLEKEKYWWFLKQIRCRGEPIFGKKSSSNQDQTIKTTKRLKPK
jgi:hypothetical protein